MTTAETLGAGNLFDIPETDLMDMSKIGMIFEVEDVILRFTGSTRGPSQEYLAQRRQFIGPAADITHPEFGRPNLPSETFALSYRIQEVPRVQEIEGENGEKTYQEVYMHQVDEYVIDYELNLVDQIVDWPR